MYLVDSNSACVLRSQHVTIIRNIANISFPVRFQTVLELNPILHKLPENNPQPHTYCLSICSGYGGSMISNATIDSPNFLTPPFDPHKSWAPNRLTIPSHHITNNALEFCLLMYVNQPIRLVMVIAPVSTGSRTGKLTRWRAAGELPNWAKWGCMNLARCIL